MEQSGKQQRAGSNDHERSVVLLRVACGVMVLFGLVTAFTPFVSDVLFSWMIFGETGQPDSFPEEARDYVVFSHAVLGAVIAGWFGLLWWVVDGPARQDPVGAWRAVVGSLALWFVPDTIMSLTGGYWQNAVLNAAIVALFAPGLVVARPR